MTANHWSKAMRLCAEWPVDKTKRGRELATALRLYMSQEMEKQDADAEKCDALHESLLRIRTNHYRNKYPRQQNTSFTNLSAEECRAILSTECLEELEGAKRGVFATLKNWITGGSTPKTEGHGD
uniref:ubiquinol-cytochrome c reductase complex assembly factor 2 isoform X2 n=1 Tax=Myxine glutinosa TaxID=7769 RepID=UPI00358FD70D